MIFLVLTFTVDLVNKRTKLGHTPLWVASYMGYIDIVKLLVEKAGANITIPSSTNTHESTPFMISCQQGKIEVLKYFLSKNATLTETKRNDGATCLSMAAANGHLIVVKYITQITPTLINQCNNAGQSPLWLASYNGKLDVVKYLTEKGAVIEITSNDYDEILPGGSPLIVSCQGIKDK